MTEIGLSAAALTIRPRADPERGRPARRRPVAAILWNGTSGAWLGFDADERLGAAITDRTGRPASTAALAFRDLFRARGFPADRLVTPYTGDVQRRIQANWGAAGFDCGAERHLGLSENFAFAEAGPEAIAGMVRAVAARGRRRGGDRLPQISRAPSWLRSGGRTRRAGDRFGGRNPCGRAWTSPAARPGISPPMAAPFAADGEGRP